MFAYDLKSDSQLAGGPDWIKSARFNIEAKAGEEQSAAFQKLPPDQRAAQTKLMVQSLLIERFRLKISHQTKELPIYALVVAKGGLKLKPTTVVPQTSPGSDPVPLPAVHRGISLKGRGELAGNDAPIGMLADVLSQMPEAAGRTVLDRTGLAGSYDWTLRWAPETPPPGFRGADNPLASISEPDTTGPSIFTALQEQLGLKLESAKGPVKVLVIDHVEKPSPN